MKPLSRRSALALGVTGTAVVAAGGAGLLWSRTAGLSAGSGAALKEPVTVASRQGRLAVRLEAAPARIGIGGGTASVAVFNGSLPGPTLRLDPGDRLNITLVNALAEPTNLHVHGLHVSPAGNGDNPFISVAPGQSYEYEFVLPPDHPPGTFWYHPHHHGMAADQVAAGLYGAIIVQDAAPIPVSRERVLIVSDISLDGDGQIEPVSLPERMMGREGRTVLVNGQVRPALQAAPGERERWRLINACPARYLNLQLEGPRYQLLALDGRLLAAASDTEELLLAPGNRADFLVTPGEGRWALRTDPYDRGSMAGMMMDRRTSADTPAELLSLDARGDPVPEHGPVPWPPVLRDLREEPVTGRRRLDFSVGTGRGMGPATMGFTINGKEFDAARVDETVSVGSVEEWTLSNSSPMDHPVHLHVWPMQIIQDGARDPAGPRWQDVVNIPANGEVKVLVAFDSFPGRTVFHCHILDHEDLGMMGVLEAR